LDRVTRAPVWATLRLLTDGMQQQYEPVKSPRKAPAKILPSVLQ